MNNDYKILTKCNICDSASLDAVFSTKAMPLTGLYVPADKQDELPTYDQSLIYCNNCGHGQLKNVVNPTILYDDTYTHRSSTSVISTSGNDFFHKYLRRIIQKQKYKSILEVGCNDLYLIDKIQDIGDSLTGIDPIWREKDHYHNKKTRILGKFIEELEVDIDIDKRPDLIISAHTFEHIDDIYNQFKALVNLSSDNCLFVIEMPSFDTMVKTARFDQVFHQHLQYLSESSMLHMINRLGCEYIDHTFNYNYWGGTVLFTFQKTTKINTSNNLKLDCIGLDVARKGFENFRELLRISHEQLKFLNEPCYGYGAAQMLPILAHHMEFEFNFLEAIIDDNSERIGKFLPGVKCPIISPSQVENFGDVAVMITALDSMRPILGRLMQLSPRRIVSPINIY